MTVYLCNIILILVYGIGLIYQKINDKKKAFFCAVASGQWILISGLRASHIGADTAGYMRAFENVARYSWQDILEALRDVYLYGITPVTSAENSLYKDPGYLVFQKIIHLFTDDAQIYLVIVAVIIFGSLAYFVYKNSEDPVFSYILFSTLFYSFYAITGIRQALATALIVFIGFEFVKEQKLGRFIIIAIVAYTLHKSAIIFVPFYFLARKKVTWRYIGILFLVTIVFLSFGSRFILGAAKLLGYDRESVYQANAVIYTIIMVLIGIAVIFFFKLIQYKGPFKNMALNGTLLASALTLFTLVDQSMMRVQQYYALFLMLSIPDILNCFEIRSRRVLRILCILVLILYLIRNNPQYAFFWQSY